VVRAEVLNNLNLLVDTGADPTLVDQKLAGKLQLVRRDARIRRLKSNNCHRKRGTSRFGVRGAVCAPEEVMDSSTLLRSR
jgi:hypothetical protein